MTKDVRDFKYLEGRLYKDAESYIERPYFLCPHYYNGVYSLLTKDINKYRINIIVEDGKITSVLSVG